MKTRRIETSFGVFAKGYQKYRRTYDKRLYKLLFSLIPVGDAAILDIGCGTGKSTEPLLQYAGPRKISVTGIDPDEQMLREARLSAKKKKLPIVYIRGEAAKLPFKKGTFDATIAGAAFHWFGNARSLIKIKGVLKDGGVFVVFWAQFVKRKKSAIGSNIYGKYKWTGIPQKFRGQTYVSELLSKAGFRNVKEAKIGFTEKKTLSQIMGVMKTNSSYSMMSPKTRKAFMGEMTRAYREAMGKNKTVTDRLKLLICYGFK